MLRITRTIPNRISGMLLISALFILHNTYRIHLHRTEAIALSHYIKTYPLAFTTHLHTSIRTRTKNLFFGIHVYTVPLWTILALHQLLSRTHTRRTHANAGRALVVCSITLCISAMAFLREQRTETGWFTFKNGSCLFVVYWIVCFVGMRGAHHAFWGVQLCSVGFGTALLRVLVFLWLWVTGGVVHEHRYQLVLGYAMCLAVVANPFLVWAIWGVRWNKTLSGTSTAE